ncbi:unnamed protein product [Mytilus coruscus]|uniref:Glucose-methanol-choline oxidoreductase C-terminal domain-containing protein n=1 Tax=Mytilus coruscus TaxID=42192 RepID=A0A6J8CW88_MYTCO|nr:unnamed protein product [Mytilus coruscus]
MCIEFQFDVLSVESYNLKCPSQSHCKLWAQVKCNSTLKYFCLFNNVEEQYVEGCNGPDWDRKGSRRIFARHFSRLECIQQRFQPIIFWTNESMSDCIYAKSICSEEGQIVYKYDSTKDDTTCRCDYKNNFSFIKTPRNFCFCIPTEEDCSCFIKSCPVNQTLSAGRLFALNPITIDTKKLCKFIDMSERYPAMILQQLLLEYCSLNNVSIEDVLREEQHQLYHKRIKTDSCCKCTTGLATFIKVIPEKIWKMLYEEKEDSGSHICPLHLKNCSERFVSKIINKFDLSVSKVLILNIPNTLIYIIHRLYVNRFDKFLMNSRHSLYHSMGKKMCCKCNKISTENTERSLIKVNEWRQLFVKDDIACQSSCKDCCCQYSLKNGIEYAEMNETMLSKIFQVAGPIGILNKIEHVPFLSYLKYTADDLPLKKELTELLNLIRDKTFCRIKFEQSNETIATKYDTRRWISRHMRQPKIKPEQQQLYVIVRDESIRKITDIIPEENCFLVVYQGLTQIVYQVIKDEFDTNCSAGILHKIHMDVQNQDDENKSQRKGICLSQIEQKQLFSPQKGESKNLPLKLMIKILKHIIEEERKTDYVAQLEVIYDIQREIVQSSSGIVTETKFQDILKCIRKAVFPFCGDLYEERLSHLQNMKNILGIYSRNGAEGSILQDVNPQDARGPQIELQLSNIAYEEGLVLDPNVAFKNEIVKEHLKRVGPNSFVVVMFLLQPRSKGYLRLSSKSPFTYPVIDPRYLSHPEDIEDFVRGIRLMRSLEQTEAWKSIGATLVRQDIPGHCSEEIYDSDNYWRCVGRHFLRSAYHFVGTCRMGSVNDPSVVVDSRLRVIGIDKLRVVDASVMRYIPSGHTNAPAMMIGEKAADMIKRDKTLGYRI